MDFVILIVTLAILAETSFLVLPRKGGRKTGRRKIYVDTSVLIDGRIVAIARSGFLDGDLIILKSVLRELQLLADGKDAIRRAKARRGLENAAALERVPEINTEIIDDLPEHPRIKVDEELLKFARENKGAVLTLDFNLIKVAEAENIPTLNINQLALAVREEFVEGEKVRIKLTEKGANRGQAVGHLDDGTMVIINNATSKIGQEVLVELTRCHETSAGKLIFAKLVES